MKHTLDKIKAGSRVVVLSIGHQSEHVQALRRIGLREGLAVDVLSNHDPAMIRFEGGCFALRKSLLRQVTCTLAKASPFG